MAIRDSTKKLLDNCLVDSVHQLGRRILETGSELSFLGNLHGRCENKYDSVASSHALKSARQHHFRGLADNPKGNWGSANTTGIYVSCSRIVNWSLRVMQHFIP